LDNRACFLHAAGQGQRYGLTELGHDEAGIGLHRLGIERHRLVIVRLVDRYVSERRMGYKSHRIEWAQPQRSVGVRGHSGEVTAGSVD
jgi:hypothetical protein